MNKYIYIYFTGERIRGKFKKVLNLIKIDLEKLCKRKVICHTDEVVG